jgi:hypothetical protein
MNLQCSSLDADKCHPFLALWTVVLFENENNYEGKPIRLLK